MENSDLTLLLQADDVQLQKLQDRISRSLKENQLLVPQLFEEIEGEKHRTFGIKAADALADFGGSWTFIIWFLLIMFLWISANAYWLLLEPFDPFPFILLNLVLSCISALQAPVILMSQNRQEDKDRLRSRSDYMINIKTELEVRDLQLKMNLVLAAIERLEKK